MCGEEAPAFTAAPKWCSELHFTFEMNLFLKKKCTQMVQNQHCEKSLLPMSPEITLTTPPQALCIFF
jgi:hypothetical protein